MLQLAIAMIFLSFSFQNSTTLRIPLHRIQSVMKPQVYMQVNGNEYTFYKASIRIT